MLKSLVVGTVALTGLAAAMGGFLPALKSKINHQWNEMTKWSEEDRRANPVAFADYAQNKLKQDLEVMQKTRRELSAEVGSLSEKLRQQQALRDDAQRAAEECRAVYQTALNGGGFPVEVRGAAYTEAQLKSQVSMLLAQAAGGEASLAKLKKVQQAAESEVETLAVRIGSTETQLAVLSTERELLRARLITNEGEELMAQMDELMTGNSQLIAGNPVRTVQDLMKVPASRSTEVASGSSVDDFLAGTSTVEPVSFETEKPGSRRAVIIEELPAGAPPVRQHKPTRPGKIKPIFQQS